MIMGWYNGIIYKPFDLKSRGATRGGRLGARPPLAPERGGAPPPEEWKERKNGENQYHRNKKTNRVIVEILLYYSQFKKYIFIFLNSQG